MKLSSGSFHGGLKGLPEHKAESTGRPIAPVFIPRELVLPMRQSIGVPAEPCVEVGQRVLKGEIIADAAAFVSVPVHAPTSGEIVAIEDRGIAHPSALSDLCIVIQPDGEDRWIERTQRDASSLSPTEIQQIIAAAGLAGQGGAGFPTFIKIQPNETLETLLVNAAECEPYITCDDMLMRERADQVIAGIRIVLQALSIDQCVIGLEDNKPEAVTALQQAIGTDPSIVVATVPVVYPSGGEKQLIKLLFDREVPHDGLPRDIGIVCQNVGTIVSVYRAVTLGEPLISRIVTVTGDGVTQPQNREVLLGTRIDELIDMCGGANNDISEAVLGGPMMGFALNSLQLPITKVANCVLVTATAVPATQKMIMPCIRCSACADACPVSLLPQQLYWHARANNLEKLDEYHLSDCIECGACAYVCPSKIPLVQYYRAGKNALKTKAEDKIKADIARERTEFRDARIEREKQEREEKRKRKRDALKAKKAESASDEKPSETLDPGADANDRSGPAAAE